MHSTLGHRSGEIRRAHPRGCNTSTLVHPLHRRFDISPQSSARRTLVFLPIEYGSSCVLLEVFPVAHVSYNHTLNKAPAGYPSRSAGTSTKPSARVVLERIDAPLVASGST